MAWTVTFSQDPASAGAVGTAVAVYDAGLPTEFTFAARVSDETGGVGEFVRAAKAALKVHENAVSIQEPMRAKIEARLNQ